MAFGSEGTVCGCRLTGSVAAAGSITGSVAVGAAVEHRPDWWDGEYDVVPDVDGKTLPVSGKTMREDVEVLAIPFAEVGNEAGGTTVTIGRGDLLWE